MAGFSVTSTYLIAHSSEPVDRDAIVQLFMGPDREVCSNRDCEFRASWGDGLGQDRTMHANWSGYNGIEQEDAVMAISAGPIVDRTQEHLVAADRAVIHLRARLLESVRRHEQREAPIGLNVDDLTAVRALADTTIAADEPRQDLVPSQPPDRGRDDTHVITRKRNERGDLDMSTA